MKIDRSVTMWNQMKARLTKLHRDESGAMSVEKILILALIALPILIALFLFRQKIVGWFSTNADQLNNDSSTST